ncbi:MAG: hypothetical protein HUK13_08210 [Muribaculaceae bacterium]|nr:hypothetical protein [Muribaculaceae bacterium]
MNETPLKERIRLAKSRMFALRNGVIADTLRKAGSPYRIIFGMNLPQLTDMATEIGFDPELGEALHANDSTRESLLLAPMLVNPLSFSREDANRWISTTPDIEAVDILCHKLLRNLPYAADLIDDNLYDLSPALSRYAALRLCLNLLTLGKIAPGQAMETAQRELARRCRLTMPLAQRILEEATLPDGE